MSEHSYWLDDDPNRDLICVTPASRGQFGTIYPGHIWCWAHHRHEEIPNAWYEREDVLRSEVIEEWKGLRRAAGELAFQSQALTERMVQYCKHRGWKMPDHTNRYSVFEFIRHLNERKPAR